MEHAKRIIRLGDACLATGRTRETFRGREFLLVKPAFWNDTDPNCFAAEIHPYFEYMPSLPDRPCVLDAGSATGHFTVAFGQIYPGSRVIAFEPSLRQRILMRRNLSLSKLQELCTIVPCGLWNANTSLAFRTHGAISSLEQVSELSGRFLFAEKVKVVRLDDWVSQNQPPRLDLIKMDIEGAELEALEGMKNVLARHRPSLLIQAYHIRDGARTLERCEKYLQLHGYQCWEANLSGMLIAKPD